MVRNDHTEIRPRTQSTDTDTHQHIKHSGTFDLTHGHDKSFDFGLLD